MPDTALNDCPLPSALLDWATCAQAGALDVGGKGWQLGLMARYGLPVPDGCVLPASRCRTELRQAGIEARAIAIADQGGDASALSSLRDDILGLPLPALREALQALVAAHGWQATPLAVRSSAPMEDSAAASFAGIHLSRLNVIGADALLAAVREVWASLWTPQAVAYRQRFGVAHDEAAMAVVIMPLVPAVAAGIAFSADPRSGRDDQMVIHAHWGLGESLVGGEADGDEYRVQEDYADSTLSLVDVHIGSKARQTVTLAEGGTRTLDTPVGDAGRRVLDDAQVLALAELVRDCATALDFGRPRYDVEWVWDGQRFWLVQARPITAMQQYTYADIAGQPTVWTNGNTRDVVPLPQSALDWCSSRCLVNTLLEQSYRQVGFALQPGVQRAALFHGRLYLNLNVVQYEAWAGFGVKPHSFNRLIGGHHPEIALPPETLGRTLGRLPYFVRYVRRVMPVFKRIGTLAAEARKQADAWRAEPYPTQAVACADFLIERTRIGRAPRALGMAQSSGGASSNLLVERLDRLLPGRGAAIASSLLAGGEPSVTAQQGYDLMALGALAHRDPALKAWLSSPSRNDHAWRDWPATHPFRLAFEAFLDRYGHRAVYESYWRTPRWAEAPGYLLDNIAALAGSDLAALQARQRATREGAWAELRRALPWWKRLGLRQLARNAIRESNARELARSANIALGYGMLPLYRHVGGLLQAQGALAEIDHAFELTTAEMAFALRGQIPPAGIAARVRDRLANRQRQAAESNPDIVYEHGDAAALAAAPPAAAPKRHDGKELHGTAIGSGHARAIARVIHHPEDGHRLQTGEILVAPSTDPAWTPLFLKAGGLVMETGGYLSHGAIVAREFGIPAVVNLPDVLARIRDGQMVEVDARNGVVRLID